MIHSSGSLVTIDVGTGETVETTIDSVLESYIGGRGVATKLAHERISFDVGSLESENSVFFTTGPLQVSNMSFTGRTNCTSVSPLTDGLLSSNAGGFLSRHIAATGYSAIEVTGVSDELVVVDVTDTGIEIAPVPELEQATVPETTAFLEDEFDRSADQVAVIGPAGENEVRFASIMTTESRAFGRGGLGAVMGSKNVKAVLFDGSSKPEIPNADVHMDVHRDAATSDHIMKRQGTTSTTSLANELEAFPTRYFQELSFDGADQIGGDAIEAKKYKTGTCSACAFACKLPTKDDETDLETEGPEFETVMAFGSNPMIDDIVSVMKSNDRCDKLGLDTISAGDVISAYLMANDEFGNDQLVHELIEKIAYRVDDGDLLAEGVHRVADELGVEDWSVKGLEFPAHDGRRFNGQALSFATSNRGADHMYSEFYLLEYPLVDEEQAVDPSGLDGKPSLLVERENICAIHDSGIICKFSGPYVDHERHEGIFGRDYEELLEIGAAIVELERHFNNQRGFDRNDDRLPYSIEGLDEALDEYYERRGWTEDGIVPDQNVV
ncbi:aldehyde ferredoxin oxidoreductase [Natrarchaeobius halalkaliphilus]|uniref:Aldehyde ferredoxin oxidoreductase n=1 Tax=Natrarchaeobius halalkaliphilus TaxID=1679091 RepID=A0A3N6M0J1_9EURY|nr:aldehyde ferredoxin oxidoreductase C-terminal domain-containing protein [Natrarchaeobius halalkaliphilus]RQG88074.1 aldehyde ferredoxin oxidoreductase [Natrarchaeobius halalkaliphilus]